MPQWFQQNQQFQLLNLPPKSPDLNPIEHAWSLLKRRLDVAGVLNKQMLWEIIQETWDAMVVDLEFWEHLCDSMPNRMNSVLAMNGGHTRY